jgi:hypothetical protein
MTEVTGRRGRKRKQILDDLKERRGYCKLKKEALDRTLWRTCFGRGYGPLVRHVKGLMNPILMSFKLLPLRQTRSQYVSVPWVKRISGGFNKCDQDHIWQDSQIVYTFCSSIMSRISNVNMTQWCFHLYFVTRKLYNGCHKTVVIILAFNNVNYIHYIERCV